MIVIYIAGPFRSASSSVPGHQDMFGVQKNIMSAAEIALSVWKEGMVALCPHLNTAFFTGSAPDTVWLAGDLEIMRRCDGVLMTPDWRRSSGAHAEHEEALRVGIPVFYDVPHLVMYRDLQGFPRRES